MDRIKFRRVATHGSYWNSITKRHFGQRRVRNVRTGQIFVSCSVKFKLISGFILLFGSLKNFLLIKITVCNLASSFNPKNKHKSTKIVVVQEFHENSTFMFPRRCSEIDTENKTFRLQWLTEELRN